MVHMDGLPKSKKRHWTLRIVAVLFFVSILGLLGWMASFSPSRSQASLPSRQGAAVCELEPRLHDRPEDVVEELGVGGHRRQSAASAAWPPVARVAASQAAGARKRPHRRRLPRRLPKSRPPISTQVPEPSFSALSRT